MCYRYSRPYSLKSASQCCLDSGYLELFLLWLMQDLYHQPYVGLAAVQLLKLQTSVCLSLEALNSKVLLFDSPTHEFRIITLRTT